MTDLRIVGIDPGTTSAVAVLDLDGRMVDYTSRKEFAKDRIIRFIVETGKPLLVACDVSPPPALVEEVASNMGAVLVAPDHDLQADYKDDLAGAFAVGVGDAHVRDALAAAEYARREHADRFRAVRQRVEREGVEERLDDVLELVVKGGLSTADAIGEVRKVPEEPVEEEQEESRDWRRIAERRQERIEVLERKVVNLEEHIDDLEDGDDHVEVTERDVRRRNREIRDLKAKLDRSRAAVERMEQENDRLRAAMERLAEGWVRVPVVDDLADADGEVVAVDEWDGERVAPGVTTVLSQDGEGLEERGVAVVDPDAVDAVDIGDALVVDPAALEGGEDTEEFMEWLETYRKR